MRARVAGMHMMMTLCTMACGGWGHCIEVTRSVPPACYDRHRGVPLFLTLSLALATTRSLALAVSPYRYGSASPYTHTGDVSQCDPGMAPISRIDSKHARIAVCATRRDATTRVRTFVVGILYSTRTHTHTIRCLQNSAGTGVSGHPETVKTEEFHMSALCVCV